VHASIRSPGVSRVGILYQADNPAGPIMSSAIEITGAKFGFQFLRLPVSDPSEVPKAFEQAAHTRVEALSWRPGSLRGLILFEINIAEFGGDLERVRNVVAYLADLGVNAVEIMPLSNVGPLRPLSPGSARRKWVNLWVDRIATF
jgi:hypothetical protein